MEATTVSLKQLGATTKHFVRRLLTIGENRLELLAVEVQEERERLLHLFFLALGIATLGLLACVTLTAAIVVLLWEFSPVIVLLTLAGLYGATGIFLYRKLRAQMRAPATLFASLEQLRKDRECMEEFFT